jgi:hypothetical protein
MFHVYQEAVPHDLWFCEHPHCPATFLPYLLWGRHHCRVCGCTTCSNHSVQNITVPSHILQISYGPITNIKTPVLAASLQEYDLPMHINLKLVCLQCISRVTSKKITAKSNQTGRFCFVFSFTIYQLSS